MDKKLILQLIKFALYQTIYILLWLPFCLLGYIIVPALVAYGLRQERKTGSWPWFNYSEAYSHYYKGLPKWASIWDNQGDSILGPPMYYPNKSLLYSAFMFNVVRNPVNGLRFTPPFNLKINPEEVRWVGSFGSYVDPKTHAFEEIANEENKSQGAKYDNKQATFWLLCWTESEPYKMNVYFQYRSKVTGRMRKLQIGFKVYPKDLQGFKIPYRASGAGNAIVSWRNV